MKKYLKTGMGLKLGKYGGMWKQLKHYFLINSV